MLHCDDQVFPFLAVYLNQWCRSVEQHASQSVHSISRLVSCPELVVAPPTHTHTLFLNKPQHFFLAVIKHFFILDTYMEEELNLNLIFNDFNAEVFL